MSNPLDALRWKNRPLLIFAPSAHAPHYRRQLELLHGLHRELSDRDMLVLEIVGDRVVTDEPALNAGTLREQLEVRPDTFAVLLVGKDGGVKLRRSRPVAPEDLFELIDAMPMRRREMREKKRGAPDG